MANVDWQVKHVPFDLTYVGSTVDITCPGLGACKAAVLYVTHNNTGEGMHQYIFTSQGFYAAGGANAIGISSQDGAATSNVNSVHDAGMAVSIPNNTTGWAATSRWSAAAITDGIRLTKVTHTIGYNFRGIAVMYYGDGITQAWTGANYVHSASQTITLGWEPNQGYAMTNQIVGLNTELAGSRFSSGWWADTPINPIAIGTRQGSVSFAIEDNSATAKCATEHQSVHAMHCRDPNGTGNEAGWTIVPTATGITINKAGTTPTNTVGFFLLMKVEDSPERFIARDTHDISGATFKISAQNYDMATNIHMFQNNNGALNTKNTLNDTLNGSLMWWGMAENKTWCHGMVDDNGAATMNCGSWHYHSKAVHYNATQGVDAEWTAKPYYNGSTNGNFRLDYTNTPSVNAYFTGLVDQTERRHIWNGDGDRVNEMYSGADPVQYVYSGSERIYG